MYSVRLIFGTGYGALCQYACVSSSQPISESKSLKSTQSGVKAFLAIILVGI